MSDLVDKIANAVPTNWCDPILTGDQAIFPKGERVPAWFEPMLLAIRERVRAEAATALEAARGDAKDAERYRWLRALTHENAEVISRWGAGCGHDPSWLDAAIDAARKEGGDD